MNQQQQQQQHLVSVLRVPLRITSLQHGSCSSDGARRRRVDHDRERPRRVHRADGEDWRAGCRGGGNLCPGSGGPAAAEVCGRGEERAALAGRRTPHEHTHVRARQHARAARSTAWSSCSSGSRRRRPGRSPPTRTASSSRSRSSPTRAPRKPSCPSCSTSRKAHRAWTWAPSCSPFCSSPRSCRLT